MDLITHWTGLLSIAIFVGAYVLVILEENIHLRKSKPVIVAAGFIWMLVAFAYTSAGDTNTAGELVRHNLLEFAELFLFLLFRAVLVLGSKTDGWMEAGYCIAAA